jgi:glycosyltransferase involved in cell wall biosynthesis
MPILISVVVCTFNRAQLLKGALESLCRQTLDRSLHEIIVVDNNSSDNTYEVVLGFDHFGSVRYCSEPRQGLSHARNRGWHEARGEYVGYLDDDCKAPTDWLSVARDVVARLSPAVFGGPYSPFYSAPTPAWFKDCYGSSHKGEEARPLAQNEYLSGGNVFFRRSLLEELNGFDPRFGMRGDSLGYGEETVMQRRIRASRPYEVIYYAPTLGVYHLVPARKMTLRWMVRQRFVDGRYSHLVFQRDRTTPPSRAQVLRAMVRTSFDFSLDMARSVFKRDPAQYPYVQNYLCERTFVHLQELGRQYERLKGSAREIPRPDSTP